MASGISRTSSIFSSRCPNEAFFDLDVVSQVELPLEVSVEMPRYRNSRSAFSGFVAFDRHNVLLGRDRNFVRREAGNCQRKSGKAVFAEPFRCFVRADSCPRSRRWADSARSKKAVETEMVETQSR